MCLTVIRWGIFLIYVDSDRQKMKVKTLVNLKYEQENQYKKEEKTTAHKKI